MMGVMNNGNQTASSSSRTLEIEEIYIKPGVEVTEDTPLLKLSKESVESIRRFLAEDVASAQIVYEQAQTAEKKAKTEAEYEQTIQTLQTAVEEAQETLTEKEEELTEANEELAQDEALLAEQKKVLENAEYTEAGTDKRENLCWWIVAWETKESAREMVETLEEEIENLGENIATCEKEVTDASTQLSLAQKNLELGKIEAESQRALRSYNGENAQEIYDVAVSQGEFELKKAREDYEEAKDKLEEFDTQIVEQIVYASGSGLITDVYVAAGDTLTQNMDLISMNDYDEVTLMNIIGCMDICDEGEYYLEGQPVHAMQEKELGNIRNKEIGFIFQNYQLIPTYDILQNIMMPLIVRGMSTKEAEEKCMPVIEMLGISHRLKHKPVELSGGQKQRVSIARALVGDPALLLADEPTGALDTGSGRDVLALFKQLHELGNTIVMITHDLNVAKSAERIVHIIDGCLTAE